MMRECGGVICLALDGPIVDRLQLPLQPRRNLIANQAMFTVSIEARDGVTTGVSAADRARTISLAGDPAAGPDDFCTPGHIFPLRAAEGGVLARTGHTEAAIEIARLAGLTPAMAICEIVNPDGQHGPAGRSAALCRAACAEYRDDQRPCAGSARMTVESALRFALVRSAYRPDIVSQLAQGAKTVLDGAKIGYDEIAVSGSLEIPAAVAMICQSRKAV